MAQVRFQLVIFKTETIYARDSLIKPKKLILYVLPSQLKNNVVIRHASFTDPEMKNCSIF